jgi:uncharacterized membrane protein
MENQPLPPVQTPQPSQSEQSTPPMNPQDIEENKLIATIAYLGILALVPLLLKKDSPYAQFHGKQGLVLLITWVIASAVMIVPVLGWFISPILHLLCFILMIVGIVNALSGETKELPWIGQYGKSLNL